MLMLLHLTFPHEPFNTLVRNGTAGQIIGKILGEIKPESVYFSEQNGQRGAVMAVHVESASQVPSLAEPWFLNFQANCEFRIAMTPADLQQAGLEELGKKWA